MITRNEFDGGPGHDRPDGLSSHQRSPHTDPDLRDGDSGRGNPLESGPDTITTDNDIGDTHPTAGADPNHDELSNVSPVPAAESSTAAGETAELDRASEEAVGAGVVEPHGPAAAAAPGRADGFDDPRGDGRRGERPRRDAGDGADEFDRRAADPDLPIRDYLKLTVPEIIRQAGMLSLDQLREVRNYEKSHRRRKTLLTKLERMLRTPPATGGGRDGDRGSGLAAPDHPHRA